MLSLSLYLLSKETNEQESREAIFIYLQRQQLAAAACMPTITTFYNLFHKRSDSKTALKISTSNKKSKQYFDIIQCINTKE